MASVQPLYWSHHVELYRFVPNEEPQCYCICRRTGKGAGGREGIQLVCGMKQRNGYGTNSIQNILRVSAEMVELISSTGIKKIRLTGGEPLLYPNIEDLIIRFKAIQGIEKIVLTTNGILLSNKVDVLKKAGISGINLSLDCIDKDLFREITRGGDIAKVLLGIKLSQKENIPLKINSVIMQGIFFFVFFFLIEFANDIKID